MSVHDAIINRWAGVSRMNKEMVLKHQDVISSQWVLWTTLLPVYCCKYVIF